MINDRLGVESVLTKRNTVILVAAMLAWRLYLSATLQLHPDEAYYWLWSRHLDIGYFDHPPLVAYFIWITTLASKSELWVRLSGTLAMLVLSGLMWRLCMQLFRNVPIASASVILFNILPFTMIGMVVMTPDVPLMLFWSISVCLFWQIIARGQAWFWYPLGATFGLALLSKYTAILMIPCFFLYLVLTEDRKWLKTRHPYLALLVGFLLFSPVIYWNSQNGWVSFLLQFRNGLGGEDLSLNMVSEYLAGQLILAGPLIWILGIYAAAIGLCRRDKETLFLICTSVPVILFFGLSSLRKVANPNWPAFAYFSFSILACKLCFDGFSRIRLSIGSAAVISTLALSLIATLHARFGLIPLAKYSQEIAAADASNAFHGWRELGAELKKYPEQTLAISPSHQLSAQIVYYTDSYIPARTAKTSRRSQFSLMDTPAEVDQKERLYVWTDTDFAGLHPEFSTRPDVANNLQVRRDGKVIRKYHIISVQKASTSPLPF